MQVNVSVTAVAARAGGLGDRLPPPLERADRGVAVPCEGRALVGARTAG